VQPGVFPFTVPWLLPTFALELSAPVTFLVGENGTGKSTLLEAIAWSVGFGAQGGIPFSVSTSLRRRLVLLDEPEAALSPQRQLAFLRILHDLTAQKIAQFVIATHSPMLLTFPGATIFTLDAGQMRRVTYQETDHFQITRDFLNAPERYYRHLLEEGD